ncbi:thiazole synthase [Prochlorococcus marinus XMU1411]|uniref:thiazole synthase n=1 Tax=Prochlorococcus marinus TaxID=1219 RepID=UPI001ADA1536|nr:thiazole synthase [Prochlorococcus marinus]MBO8244667.1 thiazole synthase [Prochlorococcus marinus XMU1411]MBW3055729.1 thiazole synthase [Prochlorococcus marinus str. MU1411]MCR8537497.1 thiazole synthase [Prochlorococcus marinus CUG1430]
MKDDSSLLIGGKQFSSRLMVGTGKYKSSQDMVESLSNSETEIITVAVRRIKNNETGENLLEKINWKKYWMLPNTAGCVNADEAVRIAILGRELAKLSGQEENNFVKLEVIPDKKYLLPDPIETLKAAEVLTKKGFAVLPYINADPILAKRLEEIGCATVMPLGSPIGSGQGLLNLSNIAIIIENAKVPVIIDAGIGVPSEASQAMELGADGVLINSAIAQSENPPLMAKAINYGVKAGRQAFLAGRIKKQDIAVASSPEKNISI